MTADMVPGNKFWIADLIVSLGFEKSPERLMARPSFYGFSISFRLTDKIWSAPFFNLNEITPFISSPFYREPFLRSRVDKF